MRFWQHSSGGCQKIKAKSSEQIKVKLETSEHEKESGMTTCQVPLPRYSNSALLIQNGVFTFTSAKLHQNRNAVWFAFARFSLLSCVTTAGLLFVHTCQTPFVHYWQLAGGIPELDSQHLVQFACRYCKIWTEHVCCFRVYFNWMRDTHVAMESPPSYLPLPRKPLSQPWHLSRCWCSASWMQTSDSHQDGGSGPILSAVKSFYSTFTPQYCKHI